MIQLVGKQEGQNSQMRKENWPRNSGQRDHLGHFRCQEYLWPFIWWMRQKVVCWPFITSLLYQSKYKVNAINSRHPRVIEIPESASLELLTGNQVFLFLLKVYSSLEIVWLTFFMVAGVTGGFLKGFEGLCLNK